MEPDRTVADELCQLIDRSPSPFHAVDTVVDRLSSHGFGELDLSAPWREVADLLLVRRAGSVVAWRQPRDVPAAFRIIGAHTDSPNLRIKPRPEHVTAHFRQLGVEVYGGALLNSWLDRDLGLSGRVMVRSDDGPVPRLFRIDEPILRVPQLAIHLDREINDKGLQLNAQTHMAPVWDLDTGRGSDAAFIETVAAAAEVDPASVLSWDAMVHDLTPSRRSGRDGVFVSAPRLDNLCSSFAAVHALIDAAGEDGPVVPVVCLYDHEEVGSTTSTGADSTMLAGVLERIVTATGGSRDDLLAALAGSVCLSADMAHATHPNYADRHEPEHHVTLNEGPVVKVNANQRYASDAESIAVFLQACADIGVPTQQFVTRTDLPCGSTIGPVTAARLGISTIDVGIAQLAMHSARELCGADDPSWYQASMAQFLRG